MYFASKNEYDRGPNTYSKQGSLWQVEYARCAVGMGSLSVGIVTREGVLLAVEKPIKSRLQDHSGFLLKLAEIDSHMLSAASGRAADSVVLVDHARAEAQHHRFVFAEPLRVSSCMRAVCELALKFGRGQSHAMSRPFGVAILIGGVDQDGPALFRSDPSGTFFSYRAKAIGGGMASADELLQEHYREDLTLSEAALLAVRVFKQVIKDTITRYNFQLAAVVPDETTDSGRIRTFSPEDAQAFIDACAGEDIDTVHEARQEG